MNQKLMNWNLCSVEAFHVRLVTMQDERTMIGSGSVVPEFPRQDQRFHGADNIVIFDCFSPPIWFPASALPENQVYGCLSGEQTVGDYNFMSNPLNQGGRYPECEKHYSPSLRSGRLDSSPPHTVAKYVVRSRNESSDDLSKSMSKLNLSGAARSYSPSRHSRSDSKEDQRLSKPRVRFSSLLCHVTHFKSINPPQKRISCSTLTHSFLRL